MNSTPYTNRHLLPDEPARAALREIVGMCTAFASPLPRREEDQAEGLGRILAAAGEFIRSGTLRVASAAAPSDPVIRLYKAALGRGRLKLQLFPLGPGDSHPPHAHYNLISCQTVLSGRARMREYTLLRRLAGDLLEVREEPVKTLEPGDGVYTLERLHNIHWQQGLSAGTLLLNINWQGFLDATAMAPDRAVHGRCYIDWRRARPAEQAGHYIVPEIVQKFPAGPAG